MRRLISKVCWLLALCAFALGLYWRMRSQAAERMRPYGLFTATQILERAETLYRVIAPQADGVSIKLDHAPQEARLRYWSAECDDRSGAFPVELQWDADTGDLRSIGRPGWPLSPTPRTPQSQQEAISTARFWLTSLGLTDTGRKYRLVHAPERSHSIWSVHWEDGRESVEILSDIRTGDLIALRSWPMPSGTSVPTPISSSP